MNWCSTILSAALVVRPSGDPTADRRADVARLVAEAKPGDELRFAKGDYWFSDSLVLSGRTNLVLRADAGAVFRFRFRANGLACGAIVGILLDRCSDICLEGLTCTTDRPTSVSGRIVALHPESCAYDVRLEGDSQLDGTEPLCATDTCTDDGMPDQAFSRFHQNPVDVDDGRGGKVSKCRGVPYRIIGPGLIRVEAKKREDLDRLSVGRRIVSRLSLFGGICKISDSQRIAVRNVTVWRSPGISFTISPRSADIVFDGLRICPEPGSGAVYSSNADGIHVAGMSGTLTLKNCLFEGFGDDPLNVHGKAAELDAYEAKTGKARCGWRLFHQELRPMGSRWALAGDLLTVYDRKTFREKARVEVKVVCDKGEFVLAEPTGGTLALGDILINTRDHPSVRISDCTVRNVRSRGFLLQSQDVRVSNCSFFGTGGAGILAAPDINNWYESGPTVGLTVRNCRFERCGFRPAAFGAVTVKVNHQGPVDAFPAGVHRDIELTGCTFRDCGQGPTNVCIASATHVKVASCHLARQRAAGEPVVFVNCEDVSYDGPRTTARVGRHFAKLNENDIINPK